MGFEEEEGYIIRGLRVAAGKEENKVGRGPSTAEDIKEVLGLMLFG